MKKAVSKKYKISGTLNTPVLSLSIATLLSITVLTHAEAATVNTSTSIWMQTPTIATDYNTDSASSFYQGDAPVASSATNLSVLDTRINEQLSGSANAAGSAIYGSGTLTLDASASNLSIGYNSAHASASAVVGYNDRFTFDWANAGDHSTAVYASFSFNIFGSIDDGGTYLDSNNFTSNYANLKVDSSLEYGPHYAGVSWTGSEMDGIFSQVATIDNVKIFDPIYGFATLNLTAVMNAVVQVDHQDTATSQSIAMVGTLDSVFSSPDSTIIAIDQSLPPAPVPVPAALWLFGSGLIGLVAVSRRKPQDA
ncbi:MAG: VPLPA-CTERM sorting domain-containing protein [Gammaproteobacteria bacterium]|nr:VPLPA-CTERM sorting domain-containing protein [Gammaproteobacteria bacterium]